MFYLSKLIHKQKAHVMSDGLSPALSFLIPISVSRTHAILCHFVRRHGGPQPISVFSFPVIHTHPDTKPQVIFKPGSPANADHTLPPFPASTPAHRPLPARPRRYTRETGRCTHAPGSLAYHTQTEIIKSPTVLYMLLPIKRMGAIKYTENEFIHTWAIKMPKHN